MLNEKGFGLIEVMIASVVLASGVLGVMAMTYQAANDNTQAQVLSKGLARSADNIERIIGGPYDHFLLDDDDGDGTRQDTNQDGLDDDGGDFGLNDFPGCATILQNRGNMWNCTDGQADGMVFSVPNGNVFFQDIVNPAVNLNRKDETGDIVYWNIADDYPLKYVKTIRFFVVSSQRPNYPIILEYVIPQGL